MSNRSKRSTPPPKVLLTPENFNRLITDHGSFVRVTPSIVCPRRSGDFVEVDSTNHDLNCPLCQGILAIDVEDEAVEDYCFIQSVKLDKDFDQAGIFDVKDALASFRNSVRVSYWYRIEMLDFATEYNELIKRGDGTEDILRYPYCSCPEVNNKTLIIDHYGNRFVLGNDFQLEDGSRSIVWSSNKPKTGKLYSVLYPVLPTFRVLELMHETRNYYVDLRRPERTPTPLPQQAHIRWDFLARKEGSDRKL